jgi:hypothetical protein
VAKVSPDAVRSLESSETDRRRDRNENPSAKAGVSLFSVVDFLLIVVAVVIAIAALTTIPIMISVAALDIHADSDFLGTNRTGNYRGRGKEDGQRTAPRTL